MLAKRGGGGGRGLTPTRKIDPRARVIPNLSLAMCPPKTFLGPYLPDSGDGTGTESPPQATCCEKFGKIWTCACFFPRDALLARYAVVQCLSVRLSVCLSVGRKPLLYQRLNIGSRKQRLQYPKDSRSILQQISTKFQWYHTKREASNAGRVGTNCVFSTGQKGSGSEALPPKICKRTEKQTVDRPQIYIVKYSRFTTLNRNCRHMD